MGQFKNYFNELVPDLVPMAYPGGKWVEVHPPSHQNLFKT